MLRKLDFRSVILFNHDLTPMLCKPLMSNTLESGIWLICIICPICLIELISENGVSQFDAHKIDNSSSISHCHPTVFLRPGTAYRDPTKTLQPPKEINFVLVNYQDKDPPRKKRQQAASSSPIDSPYRYTKNGWENSADWHIETKYTEPISIWVSIHPAVWSGGILISALMILFGMSRDSEFA